MENTLSLIFLAITAFAYLLIAYLASKNIKTENEYLLGDRNFNLSSITLTLIATQLGAGMMFGTAQEAFYKGFSGVSYNLGMALGLIVLAFGIGGKLRALNLTSTAELFERKFNSKFLRKFAGLISIITMTGILSAQIVASRQLYLSMFNLSQAWLVLFWIIIIFYTMYGGLKAVIATDKFQVYFMVLIFSGLFIYIFPFKHTKEIVYFAFTYSEKVNHSEILPIIIATVCFSIIEQDIALRFFAAKNKKIANISSFLAAIFLILFSFIPLFLGVYAKNIGLNLKPGQSPLSSLFEETLPTFGITLAACALLAAICSTADSVLSAASTNVIVDFGTKNQKKSILFSRIVTALVGMLALIIGFFFDNIIHIIIKSYEISISTLFVSIIFAIFSNKTYKASAYLSTFSGFFSFLLLNLFKANPYNTIYAITISFFFYFIGIISYKYTHNPYHK